MNPFVKTFVASGAITHRALLKFTATAGVVAIATAATDIIAGVADCPNGAADGGRVDVVVHGPAEIVAGGTIAQGVFFTAGAAGAAVAAAPAAGANNRVAGMTLAPAVSGDIVKAFVNPASVQG